MDSFFSYGLILVLSTLTLVFGIEFFGYIGTDYKLKEINENAIELIQNKGGYTEEVEAKVNEWIKENNLEQYGVTVVESPAETLDWQEPFTFKIEGMYRYRAINVFGTGIGNIDATLAAKGSGASQVYPHL